MIILKINKNLIKLTKIRMALAIAAQAILTIFLSCVSSVSFEGVFAKEIITVITGVEYISIAFLACSIFVVLRTYIFPYIECANQGSGNDGKYVSNVFNDHDDYMDSIQKKDGRMELVIYATTRATMDEAINFFNTMVHYNSVIWLMWGFICWAYTGHLITLLCFCVAAIMQIELYRPLGSLAEKSITITIKKEGEQNNV